MALGRQGQQSMVLPHGVRLLMAILMTLPLIRIISGGQTGADQAGLEAGWAPKGFRTESGLNLKLRDTYNLAEHASWEYPPRTELNVIQSDTTLIFGRSDSPGTKFTKNFCLKTGRGFIEVYWEAGYRIEVVNSDPRLYFFVSHLERHISRDGSKGVRVLNVAGNRDLRRLFKFSSYRLGRQSSPTSPKNPRPSTPRLRASVLRMVWRNDLGGETRRLNPPLHN